MAECKQPRWDSRLEGGTQGENGLGEEWGDHGIEAPDGAVVEAETGEAAAALDRVVALDLAGWCVPV